MIQITKSSIIYDNSPLLHFNYFTFDSNSLHISRTQSSLQSTLGCTLFSQATQPQPNHEPINYFGHLSLVNCQSANHSASSSSPSNKVSAHRYFPHTPTAKRRQHILTESQHPHWLVTERQATRAQLQGLHHTHTHVHITSSTHLDFRFYFSFFLILSIYFYHFLCHTLVGLFTLSRGRGRIADVHSKKVDVAAAAANTARRLRLVEQN